MISIQQMHYIVTLSEVLHFQKASELCFVTQPTLSMQVKKAEDVLGSAVFDRSKNPLELTSFGKIMMPIFRDTLNEYGKIEDAVRRLSGGYREEIRVAVIPTVANYLLPELFSYWKDELMNVQINIEELTTVEMLNAMELGRIDVGILAGPVSNPKLRVSHMFLEEILAYFPANKGKQVSVAKLKTENPWLLSSGNCLRTQMIHFCQLTNGESEGEWNYEGGNIPLLENMVDNHGGYTLVPANYVNKNEANYKRVVSKMGEYPVREVIAITPNRTPKWHVLERIIRMVQLKYSSEKGNEKYQLLNWK